MTKRRPSWSNWQWRVAAIVCGLFLLNASSTVLAAGKKTSAKPATARHLASRHGKSVKRTKTAQRSIPPASPDQEFGQADLLDESASGLRGHASFYGQGFRGRKTSTGDIFNVNLFTAASNRFPLGTMLAVRRVDNDRCAIVKVNDRMHANHRQRIIDVSRGVAEYLDMVRAGVVMVRVMPLPGGKAGKGNESCHAAFAPGQECASCAPEELESKAPWPAGRGMPEKLPGFGSWGGD